MSWNKSSDYNNIHGATIKIQIMKVLLHISFSPLITHVSYIPEHSPQQFFFFFFFSDFFNCCLLDGDSKLYTQTKTLHHCHGKKSHSDHFCISLEVLVFVLQSSQPYDSCDTLMWYFLLAITAVGQREIQHQAATAKFQTWNEQYKIVFQHP